MTVQIANLAESSTRTFDITGLTNKDILDAIVEGLKVTKGLVYPAGFALDGDDAVVLKNASGAQFLGRLPEQTSAFYSISVNETD